MPHSVTPAISVRAIPSSHSATTFCPNNTPKSRNQVISTAYYSQCPSSPDPLSVPPGLSRPPSRSDLSTSRTSSTSAFTFYHRRIRKTCGGITRRILGTDLWLVFVALFPLTLKTSTSWRLRSSPLVSLASVLLSTLLTGTCEYYFGAYFGREVKPYWREESDGAGCKGEDGRRPSKGRC